MTGFLTRLVERARGSAPRVEPLIASRFAFAGPAREPAEPETAQGHETRGLEVPSAHEIAVPTERFLHADRATETGVAMASEIERNSASLLMPLRKADIASQARGFRGDDPEMSLPREHDQRPLADVARAYDAVEWTRPSTAPRDDNSQRRPATSQDGAAPIVRVTIGRIEVRAAAPPTTTPTSRRAKEKSPALTLDAYLRSRKEGRR